MIQYIRGELAALEEDRIIVDVGGIGYGIFMSCLLYTSDAADEL